MENLIAQSREMGIAVGPSSVEQVLGVLADRRGLIVLESLYGHGPYGRYSILAWEPVRLLCCRDDDDAKPFEILEETTSFLSPPAVEHQVPLVGGWLGYLGYEAGRFLERLPGRAICDLQLPFAWFGLYDTVAVFDHATKRWYVAGVEFPEKEFGPRTSLERRLQEMEDIILRASTTVLPETKVACRGGSTLEFDQPAYVAKVNRILDYIRAGDIYQANLTERFSLEVDSPGLDIYRSLRQENRGDYAAFLSCGEFEVLCSSPELFMHVCNGQVLTRPIKGTRPRSDDPGLDEAFKNELYSSEKDLAELAMIVDLERNDLGRVCRDITAVWPPVIESYDTVHHLVADIRGTLQPGRSLIDLLQATFPGGSITGCPKIRSMEIIDDLEPVARGPYCGAIGYIGLDGSMTMNIAIRTMITKGGKVHVHAGGGIVADSDPQAEYEEVLAKAKGMLAALNIFTD